MQEDVRKRDGMEEAFFVHTEAKQYSQRRLWIYETPRSRRQITRTLNTVTRS